MTIKAFDGIKPVIAESVYVDDTALVIGDVSIANDSSIWPMTVVRGDVNKITIGHTTNIQDGSILHVTHPHQKHHPRRCRSPYQSPFSVRYRQPMES